MIRASFVADRGPILAAIALWLTLLAVPSAAARADPSSGAEEHEPPSKRPVSLVERTESLGVLYRSDTNPFVQELWLLGRYHGQYHESNASVAPDEDWEHRRVRIKGQARFFEKLVQPRTTHASTCLSKRMVHSAPFVLESFEAASRLSQVRRQNSAACSRAVRFLSRAYGL